MVEADLHPWRINKHHHKKRCMDTAERSTYQSNKAVGHKTQGNPVSQTDNYRLTTALAGRSPPLQPTSSGSGHSVTAQTHIPASTTKASGCLILSAMLRALLGCSVAVTGSLWCNPYTLDMRNTSLVAIHAHRDGNDLDFYRDVDRTSVRTLISMPDSFYAENIIGLKFTTSKGRDYLFGNWDPIGVQNHIRCQRLYSPPQNESRVYYNIPDARTGSGIQYMAFEIAHRLLLSADLPLAPRMVPSELEQCFQHHTHWRPPCYFSSCNLEGIAKVTLCRQTSHRNQPVAGMLVQYSDG
ncbi:hypothetical protein B0H67DRAFT_362014 [Lasiosphaeris hirsuta]|uniref:Uncharacterized protein n=1 Tax=Lasiosphaeris hirsuta TaxID=260670 RepID=A0AA40DII7_9PEZI|nr:hypothetical protein B0H67DRAFT_362014 [Lasiosphaeris hirsuta]